MNSILLELKHVFLPVLIVLRHHFSVKLLVRRDHAIARAKQTFATLYPERPHAGIWKIRCFSDGYGVYFFERMNPPEMGRPHFLVVIYVTENSAEEADIWAPKFHLCIK